MGYRDSSGISYRFFAGPISACPALASCSQQRAECSNRLRGQSNARESSYPHSLPTRERERFYKCSFYSSNEGGWPTPGSKFTSSKPVHPLRTFQDGRDTHAPGPSREGRLHGENRPKRCKLYDTGLEKPSEIPSVYLEGNNVRVCMPTFRTVKCPSGVHKVNETCGCSIKETGYSSYYIPGRHTYYGRDRNPSQSTCTDNLQPSGGSRVCDKLSEIQPHPVQKDGISGIFSRFPSTDPCSSSRQNSKSKERVSESPGFAGTVRELAKVLGHLTSTIQDDCSFADGQCVRSTLHKQDGRIGAYSTKSL